MNGQPVEILQVDSLPSWTEARLQQEFNVTQVASVRDKPDEPGRFRGLAGFGYIGADQAFFQSLPNLEIVSCYGVGYDGIDVVAARDRSIAVTNTPDVLNDCVADFGMSLILAVMRRMVEGDKYVRSGRWAKDGMMAFGHTPRGKRLGIVGLGRIGRELAHRAEAFGMDIAYYNRNPRGDLSYPYFPSARQLAEAVDVLALTCPGGPETRHLINAEVLAALGTSGVLVNIARGSVVDEAALVQAIEDGTIAGAGIDVFEAEPRVPEALFKFDNVVLQPHQASATVETRMAMGNLMVDNLVAHFAGKPLLTPVA